MMPMAHPAVLLELSAQHEALARAAHGETEVTGPRNGRTASEGRAAATNGPETSEREPAAAVTPVSTVRRRRMP